MNSIDLNCFNQILDDNEKKYAELQTAYEKLDQYRRRLERRTSERISLSNLSNLSVVLVNKEKQEVTVQAIKDVNNYSLSFIVDKGAIFEQIRDAQKIKIQVLGKDIAEKKIRYINFYPHKNDQYIVSIHFADQKLKYIPRSMIKRISDNHYSVQENVDTSSFISSLLNDDSPHLEKRSGSRIRLSFEDHFSVSCYDNSEQLLFRSNKITNISSKGLTFFLDRQHLNDVPTIKTVHIFYKNEELSSRIIEACRVDENTIGQNEVQIGILFDSDVKLLRLPNTIAYHDIDSVRIPEKKHLDSIIQSVISNQYDVKIKEITNNFEKEQVYKMRYSVYSEESKVDKSVYPGGLMTDHYDSFSKIFGSYIKNRLVASVRIISGVNINNFELNETIDLKTINLLDPTKKYVEISRLSIDRFYRKNFNDNINISLLIFLEIYRISLIEKFDNILIGCYETYENLYSMIGFEKIHGPIDIAGFDYSNINYKSIIMQLSVSQCEQTMNPNLAPLFARVRKKTAAYANLNSDNSTWIN